MTLAAGLLALALLVQPREVYHWRDAKGQPHVTNTPPPPGAERVEAPPPPAVEPGHPEPPIHPKTSKMDRRRGTLSAAQQESWRALDQFLTSARQRGDSQTLQAVVDSLVSDSLWGSGLWAIPLLPILSITLMGLLGWWLALGLKPGSQLPLVGGFLLLGLAFGQILLASFLYHPQAERLRQNMELLELHMGGGKEPRPEAQARLQQCYQNLERSADPLQLPWRFPGQVGILRREMKKVMVDP